MSSDSETDEETTIANDLVVTKYKMAAEITNDVLKMVLSKCVAGASVLELCEFGDSLILEKASKVFKKDTDIKKGIAFPTCISVNNIICHFSPLPSEPDMTLEDGDVVKVDLGSHIDGYSALVAHTIVVGATKENRVTGKKADVILAAHYAAELALRQVKPGNKNFTITDNIQKVAESFKCKPVEGMLSYKISQMKIDDEKSIILNPNPQQRSAQKSIDFMIHEVYAVDSLVSTGVGKPKEHTARTTVFKKNDIVYNLKMKSSRQFFHDVERMAGDLAFSLRIFDDEKKAKLGTTECVKHELIEAFPVIMENQGEFVAQFKFTVLLMPSGPMRITGIPLDMDLYQSEYKITDQSLKDILATSTNRKGAKKKKKKIAKQLQKGDIGPLATPATANGSV